MIYFLGGIKHCGKSTLGRLAAQATGWPFSDLDDLIDPGPFSSLREMYRHDDGALFRQEEARALEQLMESTSPDDTLLTALGGGTLDNPRAAHILANHSHPRRIIYLQEAADILFERIMARGTPPFLEAPTPAALRARFDKLYRHRDNLYQEQADIILPLRGRPVEEALTLLLKELPHER